MHTPDGIGYGVSAWKAAIATLEAQGEQPERYRVALRLYAESVDAAHRVRLEWVKLGCPAMTFGSAGQPAAHPMLKAMRDAEAHSFALAGQLLLTPESRVRAARSRGGRQIGQSQSADRNARIRLAT